MKIEQQARSESPLEQIRRKRAATVRQTPSGKASLRRVYKGLSAEDQKLLEHLLTHEQDVIDNPVFYEPDSEKIIYEDAPQIARADTSWYHPVMDDATGGSSRPRNDKPGTQILLTAAEERVIFRQYNYARHRVRQLQREIWASPDKTPTEEQARELLRWKKKAEAYREQIAEINLALVLAMAKRARMSEVDFADLVSEGNMALMRAVDKFDCERGFKFSTYACRAILKAFSRQGMKLSKHRQRFPTDFDPKLEKSDYLERKREELEKDAAEEVKRIVLENRAELSEIERQVIEHR
ncbi:MAG: sigma-70 family RNA polymerase sigma factor, partial [Planctomycetota bacterium]